MKTIFVRSLSGLVYVLLIFLCTTNFLSDIVYVYFDHKINSYHLLYALLTLFLIGSSYETVKLLKYTNLIYKILTFILIGIVYYTFTQNFFNGSFSLKLLYWRYILVLVLFVLCILTLFYFSNELYTDSAKLIFAIAYLSLPFGLSLSIPRSNNPLTPEIFYIFLLLWISDSFAYLIGSKFGEKKLAPHISPNKSVEGLIGGIVSTLIAGLIIEYYEPRLRGNWIVISIIIAILAPIGDLAESKLKRKFNVKDSGNLIPGHGGLLDRLDSFIFCIPAVFAYYLLSTIV